MKMAFIFFFPSRKCCSSDKFSQVWEGSASLGSLGKAVAVLVIKELRCNLGLSVSCLYLQFKNVYVSEVRVPTSITATSHSWELLALNSLGMLLAYSVTPPLPLL